MAEHRVLSFIPYLQHAPTHKQTGKDAIALDEHTGERTGRRDSLTSADSTQEAQVSANSVHDPYGPRKWRSSMVELSGKNRALNEFSVERVGEQVDNNLVILHGYGAGLGFFYKNFESLSRVKGWQLYALDLLGMGRSTRPPFKITAKNREDAITKAEDWFIDALEEWRVKRKIERFTLLGHSLGGYMAVAYALKYPGRLNKLILASPVGIPEDPYAISADVPEPSDSTVANEVTQDQNEITAESSNGQQDMQNARYKLAANGGPNVNKATPPPRRVLPKWFTYLWDSNVSPFSLIRWSGPLGPSLVSGWTSRRFSHLPEPEALALHDYAYSVFRMRGSGEYALAHILAPGAHARSPLIQRIHGVGRQIIDDSASSSPLPSTSSTPASKACSTFGWGKSASDSANTPTEAAEPTNSPAPSTPVMINPPRRETGIPIVLMYGEHDWMDVAGGLAAEQKIKDEKARLLKDATPEEREADRGSAKVVVIKKAGHHVYLDGWEEFNRVVQDEMKDVSDNP